MIIFTLKERRLIDEAVTQFGDDDERRVWRDWVIDHPEIRYDPAASPEDGKGVMPWEVLDVATKNLRRLERSLQAKIDAERTLDDEAAELCNDLAEINSTIEAVRGSGASLPRA